MRSFNPLQKEFISNILSNILLIPSLYFFYRALQPLGQDLILYFALSMFDWLLFILSLSAVSVLQLLRKHPELVRGLRFSRKPKQAQEEKQHRFSVRKEKEKKAEKKLPLY